MKSRRVFGLMLGLATGLALGDMTRYGFSGINYVPSADKTFGPDFSTGYFLDVKNPSGQESYPNGLCVLVSLTSLPIEIGFSNTYELASGGDHGGFAPQTAGTPIPIIPSLKYALGETPTAWGQWRLATGFAMPYGAYAVAGFASSFPYVQPHASVGLSSRYTAFHIFGGVQLYFTDPAKKILPLYFTSDFAFGNSLQQLNQVEEGFYSFGARLNAGQHLQLGMVYRADTEYSTLQNDGFVVFSVTAYFNPLARRMSP